MPAVNSVQSSGIHTAIARASAATGVDFDYLLAQARLESGLDPNARAKTSSASGLYQFISNTWLETLDRHGANHGLGWAEAAIDSSNGRPHVSNPAIRAQILALRNDPVASANMAAELARDNASVLRTVLSREPDAADLYLAHFLGAAGASRFLQALQTTPNHSAADLFPQPAAANNAIFFDQDRARSLDEVMLLLRSKVASAMRQGSTGSAGATNTSPAFHPVSHSVGQFGIAAVSPAVLAEHAPVGRPSMAETLRSMFGSNHSGYNTFKNSARNTDYLPSNIDAAYTRFRSFGL